MTPSAVAYITSRGGIRHIVGPPQLRSGAAKVNTLCDLHLPVGSTYAWTRDCQFCIEERAVIIRRGELKWVIARARRDHGVRA